MVAESLSKIMKKLLLTCLIVILMLVGLSAVSVPILQPGMSHELPVYKTLYVDRTITENDFDTIVEAVSEWQRATHRLVQFNVVRMPAKNIDKDNSVVIILRS
jgi:hypothetical protein